ncbi:MAG: Sugar nucleotidyltransferase [Candidatus Peribacteria bacterium GW2011_GWB1_54_5]|nr:MAG: Sugar nucleotidyltransferase [Candidatus Peribacteria bacterium GW2011_GWB1_54_5]
MQTFILAGGFATRLWPLTEKRAKPLLPLAGKPILSHLVLNTPADSPITVSTNAALAEGFTQWKKEQQRSDIAIVVEDTAHDDQKLGALGAVAQWVAQRNIDEDILLLTGDNYCGFNMQEFLRAARPGTAMLAAHDLGNREAAKAFGTVILGKDGRTIQAFEAPSCLLPPFLCSWTMPDTTRIMLAAYLRNSSDRENQWTASRLKNPGSTSVRSKPTWKPPKPS